MLSLPEKKCVKERRTSGFAPERKRTNKERALPAGGTLHADLTAVPLHNMFHDREP